MNNCAKTKIVSLVLALGMLFSMPAVNAFAYEEQSTQISGSLEVHAFGNPVYFYSDDYFTASGKEYNEHLATMSLILEMATFGGEKAPLVDSLMTKIGLTNIATNDMAAEPTNQTIGTAIGTKKIGDSNLVVVAVRGANYGKEWCSNVLAGKEGNALGFELASAKVIERLKTYIAANGLTNNKIWVVGYSRGGAVADLTGVYVNTHLDDFSTTADDMFVYTFGAPACCASNEVYDNIYNIVNTGDIVPFTYPKSWGLYLNGKKIELGTSSNIMTYTMSPDFAGVNAYKETSDTAFLTEFFGWMTSQISREQYADSYQTAISAVLDMYFSKTPEQQKAMLGFFKNDLVNTLGSDAVKGEFIKSVMGIVEKNSDCVYEELAQKIIAVLDMKKAAGQLGFVSDMEYIILKGAITPLVKAIGPVVVSDIIYYEGINYDEYYKTVNPVYNASDFDWGYVKGSIAGQQLGYAAGIDPTSVNATLDTPTMPEKEYCEDYVNGYLAGEKAGYAEGFALAKVHLTDAAAKGYFDGYNEAGQLNVKSSDDTPTAEQLLAAKSAAGALPEEYAESYKKGFADKTLENSMKPEPLLLYHFATFFGNLETILGKHYSEMMLPMLIARDSNYAKGVETVVFGDVDHDTVITSTDALHILRASVQLETLDTAQAAVADVDGNGAIDAQDAILVLRASAGVDTEYHIGDPMMIAKAD